MGFRTMREPTEIEKQQYERFKELFALSRQRYLDAGAILGVVQVVTKKMIT